MSDRDIAVLVASIIAEAERRGGSLEGAARGAGINADTLRGWKSRDLPRQIVNLMALCEFAGYEIVSDSDLERLVEARVKHELLGLVRDLVAGKTPAMPTVEGPSAEIKHQTFIDAVKQSDTEGKIKKRSSRKQA